MSYFGDNTPHQEMKDYAETVQYEFVLDDKEVVIVLLAVVNSILDPVETKSDFVRKLRKIDA